MKKILHCFFIVNLCFISYSYAAKEYLSRLNNALYKTIEFNSGVVEYTMKKAFKNTSMYNLQIAASTYDALVKQNKGKMSVEDLLFVCLQAYTKKSQNDQTWKTEAWTKCKEIFIKPLLNNAKEFAFIDNAITEAYDPTVGGPCTPPEYAENGFTSNRLCDNIGENTGNPAFEKAMITKFRTEAGCTDKGGDGCDRTCYGVCSQKDSGYEEPRELYRQYMCKEHSFVRADAKTLAWKIFKKHHLEQMPDSISGDIFMGLWGTGDKGNVIGRLQRILHVPVTKEIDNATIKAAKAYKGNLRKRFLQARWQLMKEKPNYRKFANGWAHAFLIYARNGCHTITKTPLTSANADECPFIEPIEGFDNTRPKDPSCIDAQMELAQKKSTKLKDSTKGEFLIRSDNTRIEPLIDKEEKRQYKNSSVFQQTLPH